MDRETKDYIDDKVIGIALAVFLMSLWSKNNMNVNVNGHGAAGSNPTPIPGTAGAAFTVPAGTYFSVYESAMGVFFPTDGVESNMNRYAGWVGPGTYLLAGALSVFPPNSQLPAISPTVIGELYASNTGALVTTLAAAVPLLGWGMKVGKSLAEYATVEDVFLMQRTV
jgi:hypothetical protein